MWEWKPYTISDSAYERSLERLFSSLFSERESVRVLDYGCGHGQRTERILQYLKPTSGLFLFDVDGDILENAIERTGGQRWIPGKDRFDLILCFGVLELLLPPARAKGTRTFCRLHERRLCARCSIPQLAPTRGKNNILAVTIFIPSAHICKRGQDPCRNEI